MTTHSTSGFTSGTSGFPGGIGIGQSWCKRRGSHRCRVVVIDPTLDLVEVEDDAGLIESDSIRHFLSTHRAVGCRTA